MPRREEKIKNEGQFLQGLADSLRNAARNPDINKYKPHDKQRQFHRSSKPGRQFIGGNRSGKTVGGATEAIWYALGTHPYKELPWKPPLRLRVVTVNVTDGLEKIVVPEIKRWIPASALQNGSWEDSYSKSLRTLTLANGSFIEFMTHEQDLDSFAGTSRHGIWFDEEPPKHIFTECKLRLLDTEGHWWMTMTPVEGMTWTFEEIYESPDREFIDIIEVDMDENPHLSEMGKRMVLQGLSKEDIDARKKGQYVALGGVIYPTFDFEKHVIEPHLPPVGENVHILELAGMDSGYTNPTCFLWAYVDEYGRFIVYDEYYRSQEVVATHARAVHERHIAHGRVPSYIVGDPAIRNIDTITGTSIHTEYVDNGVPIILGNNDVRAGIDRVKKLINQDKLFITKNCVNLLWEMKRYRWATWKNRADQFEKNKKEEPHKKDDHAMDTLRYMVASRPEVEDLRTIPSKGNVLGAPAAIEMDKPLIDKEAVSMRARPHVDFTLGEEF